MSYILFKLFIWADFSSRRTSMYVCLFMY